MSVVWVVSVVRVGRWQGQNGECLISERCKCEHVKASRVVSDSCVVSVKRGDVSGNECGEV